MKKFGFRTAAILTTAILVGAWLGLSSGSASAAVAFPVGPFAAQAKQVGLTAAQAASLQQEVDVLLAKMGGTQVAINKIEIKGGAVLVPLPGEKYSRDLSGNQTQAALAAGDCPFFYLCAWQFDNFMGQQVQAYTCNQNYATPWFSTGSYTNAQSAPGIAIFKGSAHQQLFTSCRPFCQRLHVDWRPVWWVEPC